MWEGYSETNRAALHRSATDYAAHALTGAIGGREVSRVDVIFTATCPGVTLHGYVRKAVSFERPEAPTVILARERE